MDDDVKLVEVEVEGDFEELVEAKLRRDGTVPIKVIRPGWGSSGYYPEKTLSKDYPVFEGARMFWNHPRRSDDDERPERDLNDLAAVLSNVRYAESGPKGPGIYGDAKVFSPFRERVGELAPYIGVSILANGKGTKGEVEGREGLVIESITSARSVDFVTAPGAGGEVVSLFESALTPDAEVPTPAEEVKHMEELKEALDRVQELETELSEVKERNEWLSDEYSRLKEAELVGQARAIVERALSESDLPEVSQTRLMESLTANPPVEANEDDITLDADGMESTVKEAIKAELTYIASLTESGRITGMGRSEEPEDEGSEKMAEAFERLGLSESAAKIAAVGR